MQDQIDKLLYDYNNKITAQNTSETQKLLVFSVGRHNIFAESQFVGGLADRLKGLVTAFYLAVMTSRRFVIYWKSPVALENNLAPHKYDWSFENARKFIYGHHDLKHFDLIDRSEVIDKTNARDLEADLFHDDPVIIMNMNSYRIKFVQRWFEENHAMQASYNQLFTKAFQFLFNFIPKAEFQERKERFETAKAGADKMVGVHLRTGSGNGWRDPVLDDWQNYRAVLECAFQEAEKSGAASPKFMFFSDSYEARTAVSEASWPHSVVVDLEKSSHMDRSSGVDIYSHNLTFHEFQVLSETDLIICGKGGFAALAALSGGKKLLRYQ